MAEFSQISGVRGQRDQVRAPTSRRAWRSPWEMLALIVAAASVIYIGAYVVGAAPVDGLLRLSATPTQPGQVFATQFALCGKGKRVTCVVDGDTIWLNGTKIRIADIDTPEVSSPKCAGELALGQKATARFLQLLNAGPFEVAPSEGRDTDIYGRKLRVVRRDGQSLGAVLVGEGLARVWDRARHPWCT